MLTAFFKKRNKKINFPHNKKSISGLMDGIILANKPKDLTSHDIVKKIRAILNQKKVGHFGTLDPMATGLILIGVGKATKLFSLYSKLTKTYKGQVQLGYSTDTYDSYGKSISEKNTEFPSEKRIIGIIKTFKGDILQTPPPFSAKKYKGKPLYKHAREKRRINLPPNKIKIYYLNLLKYHPPFIDFETKCSSGTYIRSLAHEVGEKTGCGGHLSALKRTHISDFSINESFTIDQISSMTHKNKINDFLIPLEELLPQFPKIILSETGASKARNGAPIKPEDISNIRFHMGSNIKDNLSGTKQIFRLFTPRGKLVALATKNQIKGELHPFTVIDTESKNLGSKGEYYAK